MCAVYGLSCPAVPLQQLLKLSAVGGDEFLFQLADGIAEGGLGDVQLFRRPGVVQDTGQDLKILELKQSQEVHLPAWFGEAGVEPEGVDSWCRV